MQASFHTVLKYVAYQHTSMQTRGVTVESKGGTIPRTPNHHGAPKSPNNVTGTFFNTIHLLRKDRFEHGGAKLASFPGRHLTSLRPWCRLVCI